MTFTYTQTTTFTITHARHLAAKIATDLKRMQRFYGSPSDADISDYETEATELLRAGYLASVSYGYRRDGNWIEPMLTYTARDLVAANADDDDPGKLRPRADTSGATFYSYLTYSSAWQVLSPDARASFQEKLPVRRTPATEPGVSGYFVQDRTYSAGGRALDRASVRSF